MSKGVVEAIELVAGAVIGAFVPGGQQIALALWAAALSTDQARRAEDKARNAYNASLRDRYAMVRNTQAPRQLVYGRCRVSGPTFFVSSYGDQRQHLVLCIALAAHEIDAIETIYFDDQVVTLDVDGNVSGVRRQEAFSIAAPAATVTLQDTPAAGTVTATARYGSQLVNLTVTSVSGTSVSVSGARSSQTGELDVYYKPDPDPYAPTDVDVRSQQFPVLAADHTYTLSAAPDAGSVHAVYLASGPDTNDATDVTVAGIAGAAVTINGATVGRTLVIYYQVSAAGVKARVRKYLGAPGQVADAGLMAELPGVWTTAHRATGIAYLVCEFLYDQDAFIGGVPNVSAVVRGMKCFDPRDGSTAWSENPALHARDLATNPLAGNLASSSIDDDAVIAAANVCDQVVTYTVGDADFTRPLYTAGYTFAVDRKPMDGLSDLCQAMGGSWVFCDGMLRMAAGAYRAPNPKTLDEDWLISDQPPVIQVGLARADLVNTFTVSVADQFQNYRVVPLPRLSPLAYRQLDGATLSQDVQFGAVTFSGQALYLASCQLRQMRQGLTVKLTCNMRAWQVERFDVVRVSLERFGWDGKLFEVVSVSWTPSGALELTLRETAPEIWDMDAGFSAVDIAPNTNMPVPWGLPPITGLAAESGDLTVLTQADGAVIPRIRLSWDPVTDPRILEGGSIEIRWWRMGDSDDDYSVVSALGSDTQVYLSGVKAGSSYLVIARTTSVVTRSAWCAQVKSPVIGSTTPPGNVVGFVASQVPGGVKFSWTPSGDLGYLDTELHVESTWHDATAPLFVGAASSYLWPWPANGTYGVAAKHRNNSDILSAAAAVISITVNDGILLGTSQLDDGAATGVSQDSYDFAGATAAAGTTTMRTVNVTPTVDCTIQFHAVLGASHVVPDSGSNVEWHVSVNGGPDVLLGICDSITGDRATYAAITSFAAAAGAVLAFKIITRKLGSTGPTLYVSSMTITEIRR